jgi:hypothetical protein
MQVLCAVQLQGTCALNKTRVLESDNISTSFQPKLTQNNIENYVVPEIIACTVGCLLVA